MPAGKGCQFVFFVLVLVTAFFPGCGGGDDAASPGPSIKEDLSNETLTVTRCDYTPSYRTVFLETEDFKHIEIHGADPDNPETQKLTLLPDSRLFRSIAKWDILIAGINETLPSGFLGRVKGMTFYPDSIELTLDLPPLETVFQYLTMDFHKTLTLAEMVQEQVCPGVELQDRGGQMVIVVDALVNDWDGDKTTFNDQIRVTGEIILSIEFGFSMDINLWTLDRLEFRPRITQTGQLTFTSKTALETRDSLALAVLQPRPFALGPLVMAPEITLFLDTSGRLSSRARIGTGFEHGYARDLIYSGKHLQDTDKTDGQVSFTSLESDIAAALDLTASISPGLDLKFFGHSGFSCSFTDRLNTTALVRTDTAQICREFNASFDRQIQVDLDFFGDHDLEYEDLLLFHEKQPWLIDESCTPLLSYHPVAVTGKDMTLTEGDGVILDGNGSYDADDVDDLYNGVYSYTWTQSRVDGLDPVALTGAQSSRASFIAPQVNRNGRVLVFWLTVTDLQGNIDRKSIQVTVKDQDGLPAIQGTLTGRLLDYGTGTLDQGLPMDHGTADPLEGVLVEAFERQPGEYTESLIGSAFTDINGNFTMATLANGCRVEFSKQGYLPLTLKDIPVRSNTTTDLGDLLAVADSRSETGDISIALADSLTNVGIKEAYLEIFNYMDSDPLKSITTDASGTGVFKDLPAGAYFVTVEAGDYHGISFALAPSKDLQSVVLPLDPKLNSLDEIRIVLSWEGEPGEKNLIDLDAHMIAPTPSGERFHLFYPYLYTSNPQSANLTLKTNLTPETDAKPSRCTETIIIKNLFDGTYSFLVHDFTHNNSLDTAMLSRSGARVTVFRGYDGVASYEIPLGQDGNVWNVLTIDGATGTITPTNTMGYQTVQQIIQSAGSYDTSYNGSGK